MSFGVETVQVVEPWLYGQLAGDPTLVDMVGGLIVNAAEDALEGSPPAYVVFSFSSARDVLGNAGQRVQVDCIYTVKAVVRGGNYDPAVPIFGRVCDLLVTDQTVSTGAGDLTCIRESIIQYPERQDGATFRHLGGTFRVRVNSAS